MCKANNKMVAIYFLLKIIAQIYKLKYETAFRLCNEIINVC